MQTLPPKYQDRRPRFSTAAKKGPIPLDHDVPDNDPSERDPSEHVEKLPAPAIPLAAMRIERLYTSGKELQYDCGHRSEVVW
jgi:hypothetical protein